MSASLELPLGTVEPGAIEATTVESFGDRLGPAAPSPAAGTASTGDVALQRNGAARSQGPDATARSTRTGIVIGRYQATVVVTVHGEVDLPRAAHLGHILADLIDGQGNLSLVVDLHDAAADAERVVLFADAAERARRRGAAITLHEPPAVLHQALRQRGLDHLVGTRLHQRGPEREPATEASPRERRAHPAGHSLSNPAERRHAR